MKFCFCFALLLAAIGLQATVCEPGALILNDADSFWRLLSTSTTGYSWPGGEGSNTDTDYYYNSQHPAQYDSILVSISEQFQVYYRHLFSRQDFPDYYEICEDELTGSGYGTWQLEYRQVKRYNTQDQLLEHRSYHSDDYGELNLWQRSEYGYDQQGNLISELLFSSTGQIIDVTESSFNQANVLTLRNKFQYYHTTGLVSQYAHEELFYSQYSAPDSIHYWQSVYPEDDYKVYNSFNPDGNVQYSEKLRNTSLEKSYSEYVWGEDRFFPLQKKTYKYLISQAEPVLSDSTLILYSYSNNFRSITKSTVYNGSQINLTSYEYNYAWCLLSVYSSSNDGDYGGFYTSYNTWEFYSAVQDDHLPPARPALCVYPNPVTNSATVKYSITEAASPILKVYNLKGQLLYSYALGAKKAGDYSHAISTISPSGKPMPSGIYLLKLEGGKQVQSAKFAVVR